MHYLHSPEKSCPLYLSNVFVFVPFHSWGLSLFEVVKRFLCPWPALWKNSIWCKMHLNWWRWLIPDWFLQSSQSVRNFQKWPSFCSLLIIIFLSFFFGRSELPGLWWGHYGTTRPNSAGSELGLFSLAEGNSTFVHLRLPFE